MGPAFSGFTQLAYVTTDLAKAIALFRERYGIPTFLERDGDMPVTYRGGPARLDLRFAIADVAGVQIELIEPRPGCVPIYFDGLPDSGFAIAFHHVSVPLPGDAARWDGFAAELAEHGREIAMTARVGETSGFLYVDEKPTLGHYVEYVWNAGTNRLKAITPGYFDPV
jgi:hypothetical protein